MFTDDSDILIELIDGLKAIPGSQLKVVYEDFDEQLKLLPGSTRRLLEAAAEQSNMQVTVKGETQAKLIRKPPRLVRG